MSVFKMVFAVVLLMAMAASLGWAEELPPINADGLPPIKRDCGSCHATHYMKAGQLLNAPVSDLCRECHSSRAGTEHRVDMVPTMAVVGLPLDGAGRMTCITCHDPHGKSGIGGMLRDWPEALCQRCHR